MSAVALLKKLAAREFGEILISTNLKPCMTSSGSGHQPSFALGNPGVLKLGRPGSLLVPQSADEAGSARTTTLIP